jgi:hypothetical protein
MVQPINYSLNVQSPFEAALGGFKIGASIADITAQRQLQEQELVRKQSLQTQVNALIQNPNPTARDFTNVAMLLPEKEAASMRANFETLSKDQQQNQLRFGGQVISAFSANQPQIGIQLLKDRALAERNSGRESEAKAYEVAAKLAENDPTSALKIAGINMAGLPGGDKVLEASIKALKAPAEIRLGEVGTIKEELVTANTPTRLALENTNTAANIRSLDSQIADRSSRLVLDRDRLKLDRDKLQSDVEAKLFELNQKGTTLDANAAKIVNDAAVAAVGSEQAAGRMLDLASRMESAGGGTGLGTSFSEKVKNLTGNQDGFSQLRNEYTRLRNTQAIKSLPPGVATDKDIELALKGLPPETADAAVLASFLRGMAKMSQYDAVAESAKSEWVNSNGTLGRANKDIDIGGIQVPKGTTYVDFARQFMDQRAQDLAADQSGRAVSGRGYMRFANPETGAVPGAQAAPAPAAPAPAPAAPAPAAPAPAPVAAPAPALAPVAAPAPAPAPIAAPVSDNVPQFIQNVPLPPPPVARAAAPMAATAAPAPAAVPTQLQAAPADIARKTQQLETVIKRLLNDRLVQKNASMKTELETGVGEISQELRNLGLTQDQIDAIIMRASKDRTTFKK